MDERRAREPYCRVSGLLEHCTGADALQRTLRFRFRARLTAGVRLTFLFLWYAKIAEHMQPRVYIETTIPSFYYEVRTEPEMVARRNWTRTWWDDQRHTYELVTSVAVLDELEAGTFPNKDQALALLADVPLAPVEPAIVEIVEAYIQRLVMPRDPTGDALHLALA